MPNEANNKLEQKSSSLPYLMQYQFIGKGGFAGLNKVSADLRFVKAPQGYWDGVYYVKYFQIKSPLLTTSGLWRSKFWHHRVKPNDPVQYDTVKNVYFDIARFTFYYANAEETQLGVALSDYKTAPSYKITTCFYVELRRVSVTLNMLNQGGMDVKNDVRGTAWFHYKTGECYGDVPRHLNSSSNLNNDWGQ